MNVAADQAARPKTVETATDRPRGFGLSVGRRVAVLTLLPLVGLGVVFALFWIGADEVGSSLGRSHADLQRSLEVKSFRDRTTAIELAMGRFLAMPGPATRTDVVAARDAANQDPARLTANDPDLARGLAAVSTGIDDVLARQDLVGFDDTSGLAGKAGAAGDGLEQAVGNDVDFSDPLGVALVDAFGKARRAQYKFMAGHDAGPKADFAAHADAARRTIDASFLSSDKKAELTAGLDAYAQAFSAWAGGIDALSAARLRAEGSIHALIDAADGVVLSASRSAADTEAELVRAQSRAVLIVAAAIAAVVLVCGLSSFLIGRGISVPIGRLAAVMRRMAAGDLDVVLEASGRGDEIGAMNEAVRAFGRAAHDKRRLEQEAEATRRAAEAERQVEEARRTNDAEADGLVVAALGTGLRRLSAGDLVVRLTTPFAPKSEPLRLDFNTAVDRLKEAIGSVGQATQGIRRRTAEISGAAQDLSRRTEQQAANLQETAASLDEVTATVGQAAQNADQARRIVTEAKTCAETSSAVVRQAIRAMSGIETSSRQIGQIIGVIDEIAFQTNLLALNAGVEAARAGDAGRGFAVVASEVRALAQRSADAAREIKALISTSSAQVDEGVGLVAETGTALDRIAVQVSDLSGAVSAIAASAQEQAGALQEINGAVNRMDQMTQQNAAMVEETNAAARSLGGETEDLARAVGHFDTGEAGAAGRSDERFDHLRSALREATPRSGAALIPLRRSGAARPTLKIIGTND